MTEKVDCPICLSSVRKFKTLDCSHHILRHETCKTYPLAESRRRVDQVFVPVLPPRRVAPAVVLEQFNNVPLLDLRLVQVDEQVARVQLRPVASELLRIS